MSNIVLVPVSVGELFDKISILQIKSERLSDETKLANVNHELQLLDEIASSLELPDEGGIAAVLPKLKEVNEQIWDAEDTIRDLEHRGVFDASFIAVGRSIYRLNDARAAAKRELNILTRSTVIEEKSYVQYGTNDAQ